MGREWYRSGRSATKRGEKDSPTPSGCMSAFLQLFDFHPFQFPLNHQHSPSPIPVSVLPQEPTTISPKGVEAPRNSLESFEATQSSSIFEEEQMGIQVKTSGDTSAKPPCASKARTTTDNDLCSESSSSPGPKTPNLVARLMGLDLLPESSPPPLPSDPMALRRSQLRRISTENMRVRNRPKGHRMSSQNARNLSGTRSLPETPRISSARQSDVDARHSLQINKENVSFGEDLFSRCSISGRRDSKLADDGSPGRYARRIVKQVKESVSRRVGLDITNTIKSGENRGNRAEELMPIKPKKSSTAVAKFVMDENSPGKNVTPTCSPKLRFSESKGKPVSSYGIKDQTRSLITSIDDKAQSKKVSPKPKSQPLQDKQKLRDGPIQRCRKASEEQRYRYESRIGKPSRSLEAIRNKQEEPYVHPSTGAKCNGLDRNFKRIPLSSELIVTNAMTRVPSKRDPSPPPPAKSSLLQLSQVSSSPTPKRCSHQPASVSSSHAQEAMHVPAIQSSIDVSLSKKCERAAFDYITRILECHEIDSGIPISLSKSHFLDCSIFDRLESSFTAATTTTAVLLGGSSLDHRWNRKLIFDLVDEILAGNPRSAINLKSLVRGSNVRCGRMKGQKLVDTLCNKIGGFPTADCRVLEDIDGLVGWDLTRGSEVDAWEPYDEEGEGIALEIEKDIMDALVRDTATGCFGGSRHGLRSVRERRG